MLLGVIHRQQPVVLKVLACFRVGYNRYDRGKEDERSDHREHDEERRME